MPGLAQAQVGVSINIGEPGFYGQIDIGDYPRPQVVYAQPVVVDRVPEGVGVAPLYLRVPPGYAHDWRHHCHEYNACGHPVYFVKNSWYKTVYAPEYHRRHGGPGYDHHGPDGHGHHDDHHDHHDDHHDHHDDHGHHDH